MSPDAILEQIVSKLDTMDSKIDNMDGRMVAMEIKIGAMDSRMVAMESKIDTMDGRMVAMERRLESVFEQTALLTEFKNETEAALAEINKTIENKYDLILRDIELVAGEQGKQRIDIARLKAVTGER